MDQIRNVLSRSNNGYKLEEKKPSQEQDHRHIRYRVKFQVKMKEIVNEVVYFRVSQRGDQPAIVTGFCSKSLKFEERKSPKYKAVLQVESTGNSSWSNANSLTASVAKNEETICSRTFAPYTQPDNTVKGKITKERTHSDNWTVNLRNVDPKSKDHGSFEYFLRGKETDDLDAPSPGTLEVCHCSSTTQLVIPGKVVSTKRVYKKGKGMA